MVAARLFRSAGIGGDARSNRAPRGSGQAPVLAALPVGRHRASDQVALFLIRCLDTLVFGPDAWPEFEKTDKVYRQAGVKCPYGPQLALAAHGVACRLCYSFCPRGFLTDEQAEIAQIVVYLGKDKATFDSIIDPEAGLEQRQSSV